MNACFCCVRFSFFLYHSLEIALGKCHRNDLFCMERDVKPQQSIGMFLCLQVAFERSRGGGQSVDMICRELMLDEEKMQTPKRPRTKKKKGSKATSQPADETDNTLASANGASKTPSSCLVR